MITSRRRHTRFECDSSSDVWSSDLERVLPGFTQKYNVTKLVWFEPHTSIRSAIAREKEIKKWRRSKKIAAHRHFERSRPRSEERRVGKERRSRWSPYH